MSNITSNANTWNENTNNNHRSRGGRAGGGGGRCQKPLYNDRTSPFRKIDELERKLQRVNGEHSTTTENYLQMYEQLNVETKLLKDTKEALVVEEKGHAGTKQDLVVEKKSHDIIKQQLVVEKKVMTVSNKN